MLKYEETNLVERNVHSSVNLFESLDRLDTFWKMGIFERSDCNIIQWRVARSNVSIYLSPSSCNKLSAMVPTRLETRTGNKKNEFFLLIFIFFTRYYLLRYVSFTLKVIVKGNRVYAIISEIST